MSCNQRVLEYGIFTTFSVQLRNTILFYFLFQGIDKMINKKTVTSGWGAMSMFVGLRGETEELGLKAQNIWAFSGQVTFNMILICPLKHTNLKTY